MTDSQASGPAALQRLAWLDAARGVALLAMALYHLVWDLDFFGYLPQGTATSGLPALFARAVAASFLLLVGISFAAAAAGGLDARKFAVRLAKVAAAAALITAVSLAVTPETFIHFGILHHIALASLALLAMNLLPSTALPLLAVAAFALPALWPEGLALTAAPLAFLGLNPEPQPSNDFVPFFPWFGWVVLGLMAGRIVLRRAGPTTAGITPSNGLAWLGWLGRRSLVFYLVHQPVLLALVWIATQIVPPASQTFSGQCEAACISGFDAAQCADYCACFATELAARGIDPDKLRTQTPAMEGIAALCSAGMTRKP
jgi:uncharacterized membrane protein